MADHSLMDSGGWWLRGAIPGQSFHFLANAQDCRGTPARIFCKQFLLAFVSMHHRWKVVLHVTMNDESLLKIIGNEFPARLDVNQTAKLLGFAVHDVPVLLSSRLLKPLGTPAPNGPKYFALVEVLALAADRDWLHRSTRTLTNHWQRKNEQQRAKKSRQQLPEELPETGT